MKNVLEADDMHMVGLVMQDVVQRGANVNQGELR